MARKEHKKHVKDLLAQAIVHKTLDLERYRQVEIKRKLEEIAKIELVRRVRVSLIVLRTVLRLYSGHGQIHEKEIMMNFIPFSIFSSKQDFIAIT